MAIKPVKIAQDCLLVLDSRTAQSYQIPIKDNAILGSDIGNIVGLADPDFEEEEGEVNSHTNGNSNGHVKSTANGTAVRRKQRGLSVLDPGLENIAIMKSSITFIDGQRGIIKFRDMMIEDLFRDYVYEDVMHLLIWDEIPTEAKKQDTRIIMGSAGVPTEAVRKVIESFPREAESYHMILAGMAAFASGDTIIATARHQQKPVFHGNLSQADPALLRTIQYMATTTALVYCHKHNLEFTNPDPSQSLVENLVMMMGFHDKEYEGKPKPDARIVECLNKLWILYADFEMTASTAAVLQAGSALSDPVSCAISGIVAGHGPLHGGAIELAYESFGKIGSPENVKPYIAAVKAQKARLFGYGHRVLKNRDPRGALMKEIMGGKLAEDFARNPMLQIALTMDRVAREDPYFIERNLHVNVDLYGSFPYIALGFHKDAITAVTILSRFAGPLAHWRESLTQPIKLWRPRQVYESNVQIPM
ncbi:citrate synthase, putative [Talaromyces stipitatus ATCC 10500]|uniref:Citrate synthase n=1 Tax=Talaromyces stipitatus (strain ATCC 10500 / CBS 375.48 / QM 6759 / NRRL 1006) TaxID=441959 RepID=B8LZN3_TALSN|nr:citrate synthase, putative [Talaromyces stipitatus ATCC 10500]EED22456.1 citrate synthase, putative [Talaromyces stipitatus ATCC 10500]